MQVTAWPPRKTAKMIVYTSDQSVPETNWAFLMNLILCQDLCFIVFLILPWEERICTFDWLLDPRRQRATLICKSMSVVLFCWLTVSLRQTLTHFTDHQQTIALNAGNADTCDICFLINRNVLLRRLDWVSRSDLVMGQYFVRVSPRLVCFTGKMSYSYSRWFTGQLP